MASETYVFDLETKRLANEVGGWAHVEKMGLAVAVLLHVEENITHRFLDSDVESLIDKLSSCTSVIGFNLIRFDYKVLQPYGLQTGKRLREKTVDLLVHVHNALGFRVGLDNIAAETLAVSKSADGISAVNWYKNGEIEKVLAYCEQDVRVTYDIWRFGRENGFIRFRDSRSGSRKIPVSW